MVTLSHGTGATIDIIVNFKNFHHKQTDLHAFCRKKLDYV